MRYEITGEPLPILTCHLNTGEGMFTQRGAMCWMTPNLSMETTSNGGFGKALGRMFAGDSFFQNRYTAMGGPGSITFSTSFPGSIRPLTVAPGKEWILQKSCFLAAEEGVSLSVHFQKRLSTGLFGGEGFIMQRLSGSGLAFAEIDGTAAEFDLAPGQSLLVDTGCLAAMEASVQLDILPVQGAKNLLFGGEGLFHTVLTGPGKIILQSMPIPAVASALLPYLPTDRK